MGFDSCSVGKGSQMAALFFGVRLYKNGWLDYRLYFYAEPNHEKTVAVFTCGNLPWFI